MILWMLEDLDNGGKVERNPTDKGKGAGTDGAKSSGQANAQKIQGQCWNCWKKQVINRRIPGEGHSSNRVNRMLLKRRNEVKGESGKGGGKRGESKDAGSLVWNQQTGSPVTSSVASSAPQTETSRMVGTIGTIERAASDLCATTMAQQEVVNPRWIAFNLYNGAGGTVWPMNADNACEKVFRSSRSQCKTATGEMVEGQGRFRVRCQSVWGHQLHMIGDQTSVDKTLLNAGDVTDTGHALWLDGNVAYITQEDSLILTAMRMCFEKAGEHHSWNGAIDLTKERGVSASRWQAAKATWNERLMSVPMKWRLKSREVVVYRRAFGR